jgi:putative flippase GtrA
MNSAFKKDILLSLICGEIASWFLIFIIKNPQIKEFENLARMKSIVFSLPIILPLIFFVGIIGAKLFERFFQPLFQFAKFIEIGVLNTLIDMGILNLLAGLTGITSGPYLIPINVISFLTAVINSYYLNKFWTFKMGVKMVKKEFLSFVLISAIGLGINTSIVFLGTTFISPLGNFSAGAWMNIVKISAILIVMFWNFIGYKFFVFKK